MTRLQWLDDVFPISSIETRLTFVISFTGWSDIINLDHMKMNTFVGNTRHFDNEMDLALRSTPTLFQLRFAFVNFLTFDQAEQFMSGRPFQDVIVSRNWRPLSPSCIRSTCSFASTGNSTSSFYHMEKLMNNAFVGNTRHFLDDEIECDPVLPKTIRPTLTKQSDSEDLLLSVSRCSFQEV